MSNVFTSVTRQGLFSRLGNSFKGIIIGVILFAGSFVLLFWNEGEAVKQAKALKEGANVVQEIPADKIVAAYDGQLIHISGLATTTQVLHDPEFLVEENALKLIRSTEMFQWKENKSETTKDKLGGGKETVTTYTYQHGWAPDRIKSESFQHPQGHENPAPKFASVTEIAKPITVGAFRLNDRLIAKIGNAENREFTTADWEKLDPRLRAETKLYEGKIYWSAKGEPNPASPVIGDIRVTLSIVKPTEVSVIAKQHGENLEPFLTSNNRQIEMLSMGLLGAAVMFEQAQAANRLRTWIFRVVGFAAMGFGIMLVLSPISVMLNVIPILGRVAQTGIFVIAFLLAAILSLITISIAWIFYRPLIGIAILVVAALIIGLLIFAVKRLRSKPEAEEIPTVY